MDDASTLSRQKPMDEDQRQTEILRRPFQKTLKTKEQRRHVLKEGHAQGLDPRIHPLNLAEIPGDSMNRSLETNEHDLYLSEMRQTGITNNPLHAFCTLEDKAEAHHTLEEQEDILHTAHSPVKKTLKVGDRSTDLQAKGSELTGQGCAPKNSRFTSLAKIVNHLRTVNESKEILHVSVTVQADGTPEKHSPVHADAVATRNASSEEYPISEGTNILSPSESHSHTINLDSRADRDATRPQSQLKSTLKKDRSGTIKPNKRKHCQRETSEQSFDQSVGSDLADKRCLIVENLVVGEAFVASAEGSQIAERPMSPPGQHCAVCKEHVPQAGLNSHRCKVGASRTKITQNILNDYTSNLTELADQRNRINATGSIPAPLVGGIHKCDRCEQSFSSRGNLSIHLLSHVEVKVHKCNECDRTFRTENMLATHKRIHAGQHPYQCNVCGRTFNKSNTLTCHLRTHSGEKPYQCDLCDKSFTQNSALTVHKRIHSGEEPFRCELCGKTFRDKSNLRRHVRTHSGDQPFECSVCEKRFSTKDHLNTHFRIHTGDRPYQCNMCDKAFRQSSTLVGHMRIHTGELPYKCDVCQKGFRDKSNCSSHMKLHAQYSAESKPTGSNV